MQTASNRSKLSSVSWPATLPSALHQIQHGLFNKGKESHEGLTLQLALQGGGAHGAFTWGVLDRLLRDPHLAFDGISGSSAGAMNAVVMASGWLQGGRCGARAALDRFWGAVGEQMPQSLSRWLGLEMPGKALMGQLMRQMLSQLTPQQVNPMACNPLRDILVDQIDFEGLRQSSPFRLFIGATHVRTGRLRLFREHELTVDHLLASACLPTLHHTVTVEGEAYWDGGFCANPALYPLIGAGHAPDVLMVLLTAPERQLSLDSRRDIDQRLSGLAFSTHLMRELQWIDMLQRQARSHVTLWPSPQERALRRLRLHWIDVREVEALRVHDTKLLACTPFLEDLRGQGEARANQWLEQNRPHVGRRSTFDFSVFA